MSNQSALENIVRECVVALGYDAVLEIVNKSKPVAAVAVQETVKTKEEPEKRVSKVSKDLADQLLSELQKVGVTVDRNNKKDFDKIKKEFTTYVNGLTDDQYVVKKLPAHVTDFATKKNSKPDVVVEEAPKVVEVAPKKPAAKKTEPKKKTETKVTVQKEEVVPMPASGPSNAVGINELSLTELQSIDLIVTPGDKAQPGTFWDGNNGRWVTGPDDDDDEYSVEVSFEGTTYMVGEKTGRVHVEVEGQNPVFHGFIGVGKFRDMKMPK